MSPGGNPARDFQARPSSERFNLAILFLGRSAACYPLMAGSGAGLPQIFKVYSFKIAVCFSFLKMKLHGCLWFLEPYF